MTDIWTPTTLGGLRLPHRMVMAPMTRSRAEADGTPGKLAVDYYAQRAGLGLLISEGTQPSEDGQGYLNTPGLHAESHVEGWRNITTAVHDAGGYLFIQLMHAQAPHPRQRPDPRRPEMGRNQPLIKTDTSRKRRTPVASY